MLGILGGMGPLAAADLFEKVIVATRGRSDQENLPIIVMSDPSIPSRTAAILSSSSPSPFPHLRRSLHVLEEAGAQCIAIACNTAHHWYDELTAETRLPILHIADAVCRRLSESPIRVKRVAVLATKGTLRSGFYQFRLRLAGFEPLEPDPCDIDGLLEPAILAVKAGEIAGTRDLVLRAIARARAAGAECVVLACTELPIALDKPAAAPGDVLDATDALARACVEWMLARDQPPTRGRKPASTAFTAAIRRSSFMSG